MSNLTDGREIMSQLAERKTNSSGNTKRLRDTKPESTKNVKLLEVSSYTLRVTTEDKRPENVDCTPRQNKDNSRYKHALPSNQKRSIGRPPGSKNKKSIDNKNIIKSPKGTEENRICDSNKQQRGRGRPSLSKRSLKYSDAISHKYGDGIKYSHSSGTHMLKVCLDKDSKISSAIVTGCDEAVTPKRSKSRLSGYGECIIDNDTTKSENEKEHEFLDGKEENCSVEKNTTKRKRQRGRPKSVVKSTGAFSDISSNKKIHPDNFDKSPLNFNSLGREVYNCVNKRSRGRPKLSTSLKNLSEKSSRASDKEKTNSKISSAKVETSKNVINVEEFASFVKIGECDYKICPQDLSDKCEKEQHRKDSLYELECEANQIRVSYGNGVNQEENFISIPAIRKGQRGRPKVTKVTPEKDSRACDNEERDSKISCDQGDACENLINIVECSSIVKCGPYIEMQQKKCQHVLSDKCENEKHPYKTLRQFEDETNQKRVLYENDINQEENCISIPVPANRSGPRKRPTLTRGSIYLPETISRAYDNEERSSKISLDKEDACKKLVNDGEISTALIEHKICHEEISSRCEKGTNNSSFQLEGDKCYETTQQVKDKEETHICKSNKQQRGSGRPSLSKRSLKDSEAITPKYGDGIKYSHLSGTKRLKVCLDEVAKISSAMVSGGDEAVSLKRSKSRLSGHGECIIENDSTESENEKNCSVEKNSTKKKRQRGRPKNVVKTSDTFSGMSNKNTHPYNFGKNSLDFDAVGQEVNNCVQIRSRGRPKLSKSLKDLTGKKGRECDKEGTNSLISSANGETIKNLINVEEFSSFVKCGEGDNEICPQDLSDKCENEEHRNESLYQLEHETKQIRDSHGNGVNLEENCISIPAIRKGQIGRPKLTMSFTPEEDSRDSKMSYDQGDSCENLVNVEECSSFTKCGDFIEIQQKQSQQSLSDKNENGERPYKSLYHFEYETNQKRMLHENDVNQEENCISIPISANQKGPRGRPTLTRSLINMPETISRAYEETNSEISSDMAGACKKLINDAEAFTSVKCRDNEALLESKICHEEISGRSEKGTYKTSFQLGEETTQNRSLFEDDSESNSVNEKPSKANVYNLPRARPSISRDLNVTNNEELKKYLNVSKTGNDFYNENISEDEILKKDKYFEGDEELSYMPSTWKRNEERIWTDSITLERRTMGKKTHTDYPYEAEKLKEITKENKCILQ